MFAAGIVLRQSVNLVSGIVAHYPSRFNLSIVGSKAAHG